MSSDEIVGPDLGNAADTNASGNVEAASKHIEVRIDESDGTSVTARTFSICPLRLPCLRAQS